MNKIFSWIEQLQEVNTDGVEPMVGMEAVDLPLREDKVTDGGIPEEVLKMPNTNMDALLCLKLLNNL